MSEKKSRTKAATLRDTDESLDAWEKKTFSLTGDSPLLAVGTVQKRFRLHGKTDKGEWEMYKVEIRGCDGRIVTVTVNEPKKIPPTGQFICLPVFLTSQGQLREARNTLELF